ncbi:putative folate/biopterin transporter [Trypanosoma rangeli]|uniref:MMS19 nucleotide excision repair protein n=1 Tax=Trypanosoma rangeli TaxID=5698 RepID=A0A422N151_TRYRA|nr:putative folate/biopterin transporter [Trypanosoma rangeli]RNE99184.1 putative folate/biopterin transporter [Trypanosoma rangeli]|eukprot:RNE99184.1 putative folate/biopterin transporter [Trypanosoma rangeli]
MLEENLDVALEKAVSLGLNCDADTLKKLRQVPLLYLSRMMGTYLTNEKYIIEALSLLSLATAGRESLLDEEAVVVLKFFSGKLSSLQIVETSVECIARVIEDLSMQRPCSKNVFAELANGFLPNVRFQALPTKVRRSGFKIINYMLSEASVPWLTTPVLRLLLEAMDGEGEPELVVNTFEFHHFINTFADKSNLAPLKEEYFDSLSSYFPVVFSQPPGCKVTRDDLKRGLTRCMTSPLYVDSCVSFILSRLSSPSSLVKQESIAVLLELFSLNSGYIMDDLSNHVVSVVSHVRNETIKGVSLSCNEGDSYLRDCMRLLGYIGKQAHGASSSLIASWMDPVTSGALVSLSSGQAICSAYATMVHHLACSDVSCGVALLSHFMPLLLLNLHDEVDGESENVFIILSGFLTGILDLCTSDEVRCGLSSSRAEVKRSLELSSPGLLRLVESLLRALNTTTEAPSKLIMCELLSSVLSLDACLHPWLPAEMFRASYETLLLICLQGDEGIQAKAASFIARIGRLEGNALKDVLPHVIGAEIVFTTTGLETLFNALLTSSVPTALLALELLLNPSASVAAQLSETELFSLCGHALAVNADFSEEAISHLLHLVASKNTPASFEFLCELLARIPLSTRVRTVLEMIGGRQCSILAIALLVSSDADVLQVAETSEHWVTEMLNAVQDEKLLGVALQGVSAVCVHAPNAADCFLAGSTGLEPKLQLAVYAATARGLLRTGVEMNDKVESITFNLMDALCSGVDIEEALITTFFSPSSGPNKSVTLLVSIIQCLRSRETPLPSTSLRVLRQLLAKGPLDPDFEWGGILDVCEHVARQEPSEGHLTLLVELLECILSRIGSKALFMMRLLANDDALFQAVLSAVRSPALQVRCASLRLLSEVALFVMQARETNNEDDLKYKKLVAKVRDEVLHVTQCSLADHKRLVRRAAAHCRHQWYKLR